MNDRDYRAILPPDHPRRKEYDAEMEENMARMEAEGALDTQMVMVHRSQLRKCQTCGKDVLLDNAGG